MADWTDGKIYAYNMATKQPVTNNTPVRATYSTRALRTSNVQLWNIELTVTITDFGTDWYPEDGRSVAIDVENTLSDARFTVAKTSSPQTLTDTVAFSNPQTRVPSLAAPRSADLYYPDIEFTSSG